MKSVRLVSCVVALFALVIQPAFAQVPPPSVSPGMVQFGGNGSDGAITISSNTNPAHWYYNASTFTINTSTTLTALSGTVINSQGAVAINGTLASAVEIVGGPAPGTRGGPYNGGYAGGGGGCGGYGGAGAGSGGAAGGTAQQITEGLTGSVGGTGSPSTNPGQGAGNVRILSMSTITIASTGEINYMGASGSSVNGASTSGGGGGGSGGVVCLYSQQQVINSGTITVQGGGGGSGTTNANGGGGGAGGFVVMMSPTAPAQGTITYSGGGGGSAAGTGVAGTSGGTGVKIIITDTPTFPLLAEFEKRLPYYVELAKLRGGDLEIEAKENRSLLAALKATEEGKDYQTALREINKDDSTYETVQSVPEVLDNAA